MMLRYRRSRHSTVRVTCCWMTSATDAGTLTVQAPVGEVSRPPPHVGITASTRRHHARSEPVLQTKPPAALQPVGLRRSLARILNVRLFDDGATHMQTKSLNLVPVKREEILAEVEA